MIITRLPYGCYCHLLLINDLVIRDQVCETELTLSSDATPSEKF